MMPTFGSIQNIQFVTNKDTFNKLKDCSNFSDCYSINATRTCGMIGYIDMQRQYPCHEFAENRSTHTLNRSSSTYSASTHSSTSEGRSRPESISSASVEVDLRSKCHTDLRSRFEPKYLMVEPHLISTGSTRCSSSLYQIKRGSTVVGSGGMGVVPDMVLIGSGIQPEHCVLHHENGIVSLDPKSSVVFVDGVRIKKNTVLPEGCLICLGRSNYFRFNHPTDPTRTSLGAMAPVSFYPAVDNPEYYHVPSDAKQNENETDSKSTDSGKKPSVDGKSNNLQSNHDCLVNKSHLAEEKSPAGKPLLLDSDSDCPPEVPPRSEQPCSLYVNTATFSNQSANKTFVGNYICTKSEISPRSSSSLENRLSTGSTTVVSSDGATSVHNILYCSDIPHALDKSTAEPVAQERFNRSPVSPTIPYSGSNIVSNNGYKMLPKTKHVLSPTPASPPAYSNLASIPTTPPAYSNVTNNFTIPKVTGLLPKPKTPPAMVKPMNLALPENPAPPIPIGDTFESDGTLHNSLKKKRKVIEAREKEEEDAITERLRLDEILAMCAEYDKQVLDSPKNAQSPYHTLPQNRIKTNGSLPREKRSPTYSGSPNLSGLSPNGSSFLSPVSQISRGTTPEDELRCIFNYDGSHTSLSFSNARSNNLSNYPPFPIANTHSLNTSPPPMQAISPYENVSQQYTASHSPRTRIRTTLGKERKDCEIFENKMATGDFNAFSKISKISESSPPPRTESMSPRLDAPPKPPRSPKLQRSILNESYGKTEIPIRSVITNKYFYDDQSLPSNSCYDTPRRPEAKNFHTIHYSHPSSLPVKSFHNNEIDCKIKNKVFEQHMIRNIKDSLNVQNLPEEIKRLKEEHNVAMEVTAEIRRNIDDLERQENEFLRELEIERALLEAELATIRDLLGKDEQKLASLRKQSDGMDARHQRDRNNDEHFIETCKHKLEKAEESLENLEMKNETFQGTTDEETEMLELLKSQHESVEAERKLFEDTEFSQMESEAQRENEREELNKEIKELLERIANHKQKICELEEQMSAITASVCQETEALESQRQALITKISKSCAPELAEKLAKLHLLDRSQEDLDLINQVTISSPLGYADVSLDRKTSATLQEIEKNRHLLLAKSGSLVIDSERKRVEELKQRVADEVKAQWEERKARDQREINCTSLNSVGSEESSPPSSDVPTESLSSDDVQRLHCDRNRQNAVIMLRQRDKDVPSDDSIRPVSDASSFCDADSSVVRLRRDKSRTQRPLTRYLPVRAEVHFDLRQHIESAGHQLDQCPHVVVSPMACRGQLCKLSSKFKAWQKRWFVFDRSKRAILYYGDKSESKPKGGACFQDIEEVYVDHHHSKNTQNLTFCVKTHKRLYHLMARSPEAMRIWIDVIFTGAEGYREFQNGS